MDVGTSNNITNGTSWTQGVGSSSSTDSSTATAKKSKSMDMQDFLKIMAAQMKNQSLDSPTDNSQYITEMTLFSAIQAMNTQTSESNKQYASSLIGNDVLIKTVDTTTGNAKSFTGTVSKAIFNSTSGDCVIQIGDKNYNLSDVAEVYGYHNTNTSSDREYAASLVGKTVEVQTTDSDGTVHKSAGTVQNVSFDPSTGAATLALEGNHIFNVSDVIEVLGTGGSTTQT